MNSLASDYKFRKQQLQYVDSLYFRNNSNKINTPNNFPHKKKGIKYQEIDTSQIHMKQQLKIFLEKQIEEKKQQKEKEIKLKQQQDAQEELKLKKYQESIKKLYYEQQPSPKQESKREQKTPIKQIKLQKSIHFDEIKVLNQRSFQLLEQLQIFQEKEKQFQNYYMIRDHLKNVMQKHNSKLEKIYSTEREQKVDLSNYSGNSINYSPRSRSFRQVSPLRKTIFVRKKSIKEIIKEIDIIINKK